MKALILAAGLGSRLAPLTDLYPKAMVCVNNKPIIVNQIEALQSCGVYDITVVTGYKSDILKNALESKFGGINFIENKDFCTTNNMYSAYLAKESFYAKEYLMMNADVFFDHSVIKGLLNFDFPDAIVTDVGTYIEESMKIVYNNGKITHISKAITQSKAYGCSIDVYKFSPKSSVAFFDKCEEYIKTKKELNKWSEVALDDILDKTHFKPCEINGRWLEIDNHEDLLKARNLFCNEGALV